MLARLPFVKRLYPSLLRKWAALAWTGGYRIKAHRGLYLILHYKNFIDREIAFFNRYENRQIDFLMEEVGRGCDVFMDIGANFGLYAMLAARAMRGGAVHAFEPDPRNHAQLMGHLFLNRLTQDVQVHRQGVSEKSGVLNFTLYPDKSTGQTRVADGGTVQLQVVALDDVFDFRGRRIIMKVDIEGHELPAFRGCRRLLRENDCFIQVECFPENAAAVEAELKEAGYVQVRRIDHDYYYARAGR